MKIICDCGNGVNLLEPDDGENRIEDEEEGVYVKQSNYTFNFWQRHDVIGIACNKCEKKVWMFT